MKLLLYTALIIFLIASSCKKEETIDKEITFSGAVITNGTNKALRRSANYGNPVVEIYKTKYHNNIYTSLVESIPTDEHGRFSKKIDLHKYLDKQEKELLDIGDLCFYYAVSNIDPQYYFKNYYWLETSSNFELNNLNINEDRHELIEIHAKSWIRFRLINTNTGTDADSDILKVSPGGFYPRADYGTYNFYGKIDSTFEKVIPSWSGMIKEATPGQGEDGHIIRAQLTRSGIITGLKIRYSVPPFDTSTVIINY